MKEPTVKQGDVLAEKYLVESILGVGGMGVVVEAIHLELHEARAIKLLLPDALEEKEAIERFLREARRSARLKSEHVVRVHDVDKLPSGAPYVVMELLQGSDLRRVIKARGRLPVPEAVHYALQACEALAEAHGIGIVHRDLKPANLFLTTRNDGTPCIKVLDFGISKGPNDGDDELTKTQAVLGSPSYMSPEQMRSARTVDARSDIWSLGVILYRLVTGELPFRAETMAALVTKVLQTTPVPPSSIAPDLPPGLDEVLLRCLERELPLRYANVGELADALLPFAPAEARLSVERIARVIAISTLPGGHPRVTPAHGLAIPPAMPVPASSSPGREGAEPQPPGPRAPLPSTRGSGTSGDAWANTSFGSGTVAVHRWKLWALVAASAALSIALGASLLLTRRGAPPEAVPVTAVDTPKGEEAPRRGVEPPPAVRPAATTVTIDAPPAPTSAAMAEPPTPVPMGETPTPPAQPVALMQGPKPVPALVPVKGPLPGARAVKAAKSVEPSSPPPPAPVPATPPTAAPHRVFGSEN